MAGKPLQGCIACSKCSENKDRKCAVNSDNLNEYLGKMIEADGTVLGSPVYYADETATIKALIERCGYVSGANGGLFTHKVGASIAAVRRAGAIRTFDTLNHLFQYSQMFIVGSTYWNLAACRTYAGATGASPGDSLAIDRKTA